MVERSKSRRKKREKANRKKLSESNIRNLPAKQKQYLCWDDPSGKNAANGLAVLVSPRGVKSFRVVYYFPGSPKPHWKHLGRVGEMTLEEAREATRQARRKAKAGEDPRADNPAKSDSFKSIVEAWVKHVQVGESENNSAMETQAVILRTTKAWHARPVATIRYSEVEALLWAVRDGDKDQGDKDQGQRGRPYLANRLFSHLKPLFEWAARQSGPLKASPMAGMKKPWNKEKPRERDWFKGAAGDTAIQALWKAADEIGGDGGRYLKLMIITGKRPWGRENNTGIGAMCWEHITADWFWDAPASRSKNKRLHGVPLPKLAQRILHPRQAAGYVFDVNTDAIKLAVRRLTGIKDFIPHGIRHLVETKCAELRGADDQPLVPPHIRDLLFDHASGRGSGKGYDHHDYLPELRAAMRTWGDYVESKVVPEGVAKAR